MKYVVYSELIPGKLYNYCGNILRFIEQERNCSVFDLILNNEDCGLFVSKDGKIRFTNSWAYTWFIVPFKFGRN